ncbi:MAG TPA: zinc-dependent metalloprotease, partial [Acidimicrobiales bacterium]|nr:zinc-dependent metalloprotease [Acidimicrobiales bacterium]
MSDTSDPGPAGAGPGPVDWEFAKQAGARIVPAGPKVSADEAAGVVASIHRAAARAQQPVAETARLHAPGEAPAPLVVDRPTWIGLNADSMAAMVDPVFAQIVGRRKQQSSAAVAAVGGKVTGGEAGALLAFMASKVLGQYDLAPGGTPRLLLVAPNVVHVERQLGVDPDDFRLWVCMHEETHRVQFTAVPWLREHMIERARSLASEMAPDPDKLQDVLSRLSRQLPEAFKSGGTGITELIATPEQRERLAQMTAVMSLLEGHADVVMDEVGPQVIPSVAEIRAKFNERRKGVGAFDRLLRRLLGLEAKMRQYRDGAVFVRSVIDEVG